MHVLSAASQIDEDKEMDYTAGSVSAKTERQAEPESCSDADGTIDDSILISSLARPSVDHFSKRSALGKMKSERATKVNLGLTHPKMSALKGIKYLVGLSNKKLLMVPSLADPTAEFNQLLGY
ncbi:unnamed protein product [Rhodiola kirilowii]